MADIWQNIKNAFKSKAKLEEEKQEKLADAAAKEKEVVDKLKALEKQYADSQPKKETPDTDELFPDTLGLKKLDENGRTDEEIAYVANGEYQSKQEADAVALNGKYDGAKEKQNVKQGVLDTDYEKKSEEIKAAFEDAAEKAKNRAVNKGVARSSILSTQNDVLSEEKVSAEGLNYENYRTKAEAVSAEIMRLENELDNALRSLELDYAAKISKRISALEKERETARASAVKYNNSVDEKEAAYKKTRAEDEAAFLSKLSEEELKTRVALKEYEKKYGYDAAKQQNYSARFETAKTFYLSLSDDIAAAALEASPDMKYYLGIYYQPLMTLLKQRASAGGNGTTY
jgi:hypothetical protein